MSDMEGALHEVSECLRAFENSHATHRTLTISHAVHGMDENGRFTGSRDVTEEVSERIACECHLCDWARIVLGE